MLDKRLTNRLLEYWDDLRKERALPDIMHFNSSMMEDVWSHCFKLKVEPISSHKANYYYDFCGKDIVDMCGKDFSGNQVNAATHMFPGAGIIRRIDTLLGAPFPVTEDGQVVTDGGKMIKFRSCLLPFGTQQKMVTHVIGAVSWKAYG